jgi:hypothetical protein
MSARRRGELRGTVKGVDRTGEIYLIYRRADGGRTSCTCGLAKAGVKQVAPFAD